MPWGAPHRAAMRRRCWHRMALSWFGAALLAPSVGHAQNLTYGELKLGGLAHDVHFAGGKERGVDINPEVIFPKASTRTPPRPVER